MQKFNIKRIKNTIFGAFIILIVFDALFGYKITQYMKQFFNTYIQPLVKSNYSSIIFGYLIALFVAFILHYIAYICTNDVDKKSNQKIHNDFKRIKHILVRKNCFFIFTPDYVLAKFFKNKFVEGAKYKPFVNKSNYLNIILIVLVSVFVMLNPFGLVNKPIVYWGLIFHLISRVVEITYAFYKDITDDDTKSGLKSNERIPLAVNSYLEIIILFGIIYYVFSNQLFSDNSFHFIDGLIYSGTISTFNFGFEEDTNVRLKIIVLAQVFASLNLFVLSIAKYIGAKKTEEDDNNKK